MSEVFEGYTAGEVSFVIELLAAMCPAEEIQLKFNDFTEGQKKISKKNIQLITLRFGKKISEMNSRYLKNVKGNPLSHQRVRLDILERIVKQCLIERPSHSIRSGDDFEVVKKADYANAINALKLVMADLAKREELDNVKKKEAGTDIQDWEIDDGIENVG